MEAAELRRSVGTAESRQDAPNGFKVSTRAQNHPPGTFLKLCLFCKCSISKKIAVKNEFPLSQSGFRMRFFFMFLIQDGTELLHRKDAVERLGDLYDPCFLLPLFSAILQPGEMF